MVNREWAGARAAAQTLTCVTAVTSVTFITDGNAGCRTSHKYNLCLTTKA